DEHDEGGNQRLVKHSASNTLRWNKQVFYRRKNFCRNEADDYGTKPEWHPPKEPPDGKPVRVVAVAPHVRRGGSKCLEKKPCPLSETRSGLRRRPLRKTC